MFYCNPCGTAKGWPTNTPVQSHGRCEICGKGASCNDVPSGRLPKYAIGTEVYIRKADKVATVVAPYDYGGEWAYRVKGADGVLDEGWREDELSTDVPKESDLRANDQASWIATIWEALHAYREDLIPEGEPMYDDQWSDITTAMAWITERLNIPVTAERRLFFIKAGDEINNLDLFVTACDEETAVKAWDEHYELGLDDGEGPERIFEIIPNGEHGALGWNGLSDGGEVSQIGGAYA